VQEDDELLADLAARRADKVVAVGEQPDQSGDVHPDPRMWVPQLDGVERLGVAELLLAGPPEGNRQEELRVFLTLVAELIVTKDAYSDVFARLRRRKTLSLAAEMQWELLPPLTFGTERVVITGGLEPAYEIGGDSFD
jgi:hypothetical protein